MPPRLAAFQLYLPPEPHPNVWGLHPTDLGFTRIPPGHPYPPFPHPESYTLNHDEGRSLDEYQLIYISRGRGSFWSERSQAARVAAGTVILLFPGIRHRYRPDPATGWDEHWLGFTGDHAQRIMSALFAAEQPLHHVGPHAAIRAHFTASCALARREAAGYREKVGVHILAILAELNLLVPARPLSTRGDEVRVRRACTQMIQNLAKPFDSARFAREQGMSHTSFRRHFRARMGISPIQYHLNLRLRRATQLLRQTTQPVKVIAQECGFDNPYHFSKQFRKRLGQSPSEIRRGTQ